MIEQTENRLPIAVSLGDPCGIGPDLVLNAWNSRERYKLPPFFVVGNRMVLEKRAAQLGINPNFANEIDCQQDPTRLCVLETTENPNGEPGKPTEADALAAVAAIKLAVECTQEGRSSALVTCPINKKTMYDVGFEHPGHTEYLAELGQQASSERIHPVMMIAGPELRTVPVTIHTPLKDAIADLTSELIVKTCKITANDLTRFFGIENPRLAISGLNPHAGESGTLGTEDLEVIAPAVKALKDSGLNIIGPLPADTMFHPAARTGYDAAICMYHDQALIPAKTIGFDDAVNVTLGLPFIRTSPDHGTAYDIAGTGQANPSSFLASIRLAAEMANRS